MKKILSIVLTALLLMSFAVGFSYADDTVTEEQEIINAASEAMKVFDNINGYSRNETEIYVKPLYTVMFLANKSAFGPRYAKTEIKMANEEEFFNYIDKYFVDYNLSHRWVFVDKEFNDYTISRFPTTAESYYLDCTIDSDKYNDIPFAMIIDETLYVYYQIGGYTVRCYFDVSRGIVTSNDGKNAVVQFNITDGLDGEVLETETVTLKKTDEGWKINGGTVFSDDFIEHMGDNWFKNPPPQTGENTFFYLIISASALACMTALLARKRRERV